MFNPFAIQELLSDSNSNTTNETGFRYSSINDATSATVENGSILPDININARKFRKNTSCTSNLKSCNEDYIKLPTVNYKREHLPNIEDAKNYHGMIFNEMGGRTANKADCQKSRLEESLKKSLENYSQPKFYMEGESKSTHHLMLEMNEFYLEMAEQLRYLKGSLSKKKMGENTEEVDCLKATLSNYEIELDKLICSIEEDDQKVAENIRTLKEVKEERNIIQQEIQSLSEESDKEKETTQDKGDNNIIAAYLLAPDFVADLNNVEQNDKEANNGNDKKKNMQLEGKNFIAKNKELAKEYNMTRFCLTDEEKRKLQLLLSDIDVCEDRCEEIENCIDEAKSQMEEISEIKEIQDTEDVAEQDCQSGEDEQNYNSDMCINGFKLDVNDTEMLNNLDLKINFLRADINDETQQSPETDDYKNLEADETKGKHWKFQLLQKRLKNIDKDLAAISSEKEKEMENNDEKTEESENEIVIDINHIKEEYEKSVYDISVDIAELEYQEAKELEELDIGVENA